MEKVKATKIIRHENGVKVPTDDLLAAEEPLEIRLGFGPLEDRKEIKLAVTMRTPGEDVDLATGFLLTEGIIANYKDLLSIKHCKDVKPEEKGNVIRAELNPNVVLDPTQFDRNFYMTSSCGVCGKSSIDAVEVAACSLLTDFLRVDAEAIHQWPDQLFGQQSVFRHTGGLHAAALLNNEGQIILTQEDIGRHNAVDKVIGAQIAMDKKMLQHLVLLVSGRAGFEIVQKSIVAGITMMVCIGAPSSLSVQLAQQFNLTLIGFASAKKYNIYSGFQRVLN